MSVQIKIVLISAAIVVGILIFKYIVNMIVDKGVNAAENAIAKKKNKNNTNEANKEKNLSDLYKKG